eukprot:TRINITY_DN36099_c0_g1_i1.p1 TRINITY_DN36099_c0_g1~~TRINITY_DN36099_c0_g1_i1.p1  ORF type:complete len:647 (-),score=107.18 TRINITY_DN36099_c0_g1_i1:227-2167(-)
MARWFGLGSAEPSVQHGFLSAEDAVNDVSEPSSSGTKNVPIWLFTKSCPDLLRSCICSLTSVRDVLRCAAACKHWHRLARDGKWLKRSILNGSVDPSERRTLWRHLADVRSLEQRWCKKLSEDSGKCLKVRDVFDELAHKPLSQSRMGEIERDVNRTFPTHPHFKGEGAAGRVELLKILRTVAIAEPEVGYCQGMNFVAATLLIHVGTAEDAFWLLLSLIESYEFRFMFAPGVPLLPLRIYQFSGSVREHLPRLFRHLQEDGVSLDIFGHQCVLTLFAYSLEPELLAYVYDAFFLTGWKAVFRIGCGLLGALEKQLLELGPEDISHFLHQCKRHVRLPGMSTSDSRAELQPSKILAELLRFRVRKRSLADMEKAFQVKILEALLSQVTLPKSGEKSDDEVSETAPISKTAEPLPPGIERSPSKQHFLINSQSLRAGNDPPSLLLRHLQVSSSTSAGGGIAVDDQNRMLKVPAAEVQALKAELKRFDDETQQDVLSFRARVAEAERKLRDLLKSTEEFREEARQCELDWTERQIHKKALMDALEAAIASNHPTTIEVQNHQSRRQQPDRLIQQCMEKLQRLELDALEENRKYHRMTREVEPLEEDLEQLSEVKSRSSSQLQDFLDLRAKDKRSLLLTGLGRLLQQNS